MTKLNHENDLEWQWYKHGYQDGLMSQQESQDFSDIKDLVEKQATDEGLWFIAQTAPEAYLQSELRKLHALIEKSLLAQMPPVVWHLHQLLSQWQETAKLYETAPEMHAAANGYRECIEELEKILAGDLSPIECA